MMNITHTYLGLLCSYILVLMPNYTFILISVITKKYCMVFTLFSIGICLGHSLILYFYNSAL